MIDLEEMRREYQERTDAIIARFTPVPEPEPVEPEQGGWNWRDPRPCACCGKDFEPTAGHQKFCRRGPEECFPTGWLTSCAFCGARMYTARTYCSRDCARDYGRMFGKRPSLPPKLRAEIIARDGTICYLCDEEAKLIHIDHVHPVKHGGTDDPSNLRVACAPCNESKGAKLLFPCPMK